MNTNYELIAGLEIHAQLSTSTKAFCRCPNRYGAEPNTLVCPVCLGAPGALPVLSKEVVKQATKLALAIGAEIHLHSRFDRKNYFYPDLPKGYQISQFNHPFATGGELHIAVGTSVRPIRITRAHIEEDAGKSMHLADGSTVVDMNRCGVPLIEIVSEPDFREPEEAGAYLTSMRELLRFIGVCDGNMEEGSLRCDANVSVRLRGESELRERTEMKNLNSIRSVERAIRAEMQRQIQAYESGGEISRQTLQWDDQSGKLTPMRAKEGSNDYRYFPEPDLPWLEITEADIDCERELLPTLPAARRKRYREEYGLHEEAVYLLASDRAISDYFETLLVDGRAPAIAAAWVQGDVQRILNENAWDFTEFPVSAARLGGVIDAVEQGRISRNAGRDLLRRMMTDTRSADEMISAEGMEQLSDATALRGIVRELLERFPSELAKYREGKTKMIGFFMGQIMQATKGQADPNSSREILMNELDHSN
ncbi:MAG: Asp-tRNA(Asn)/Glu-tRNA(Gln) amidotransferase subunit GatB [Calditrichaeota bacterium]|nr:Asp-tRNA(Asn)/Glu-tRNA(Gln) amidotransferase subunit GatB [Calditrichota bacterium]MCB9366439.1 Asp-tRNA(Asn)/Glu-tRNA(Gln) amidotransferase subunit GatB [Calditrichota bacterium]